MLRVMNQAADGAEYGAEGSHGAQQQSDQNDGFFVSHLVIRPFSGLFPDLACLVLATSRIGSDLHFRSVKRVVVFLGVNSDAASNLNLLNGNWRVSFEKFGLIVEIYGFNGAISCLYR